VKDWLDSNNLIFYDNKISVNWGKFLQGVRADFKKFVEDGAWTAWDEEGDEGDGDISEGDS
jgi:nucleosome binding factor SPN SPT16 subunit